MLTSQRRHEDPTLTDLRAATLGTDNLYVVRVYVLHGFDMMGIVDPFLRESANLHGRKVRQPRLMSYDGDTCNLRRACGAAGEWAPRVYLFVATPHGGERALRHWP